MAQATSGRAPTPTGVRAVADVAFGYLAATFTAGAVVQVFLAGYGVFGASGAPVDVARSLDAHRAWGNVLGIVAIVLFLVAVLARTSRFAVVGALVLAALTEVAQHGLAQLGNQHSWAGGLHAADGVLILVLGGWLAISALHERESTR